MSTRRVMLGSGGDKRVLLQGRLAAAAAAWGAALGHWLAWAYQLEFGGRAVHLAVWSAGLLFLGTHALVLRELVQAV